MGALLLNPTNPPSPAAGNVDGGVRAAHRAVAMHTHQTTGPCFARKCGADKRLLNAAPVVHITHQTACTTVRRRDITGPSDGCVVGRRRDQVTEQPPTLPAPWGYITAHEFSSALVGRQLLPTSQPVK